MNTIEHLSAVADSVTRQEPIPYSELKFLHDHIPALLAVAKAADHLDYVWTMRSSDLIHHSDSSKTFDRTSQANAELKLTQALATLREAK